jgi:Asparagine synthase
VKHADSRLMPESLADAGASHIRTVGHGLDVVEGSEQMGQGGGLRPGIPQLARPRFAELLGGLFLGFEPQSVTLQQKWEEIGPHATPRGVLEEIVLRSLQRPPCLIGFSGGRDSSAVLAVAVHVARREGIELPVPLTNRFPGSPSTHEDEWQELVIKHLGLENWERRELCSELDVVGPLGQQFMRRYGVTLGHLHINAVPFSFARGGSFLDGQGGDEIFGLRRVTAIRRAFNNPKSLARFRALRHLGLAVTPNQVRAAYFRRRYRTRLESRAWLRPDPFGEVLDEVARQLSIEPLNAQESLWSHIHMRNVVHFRDNRRLVALSDYDVVDVQPLLEPDFVAAYARMVGRLGLGTRTDAMNALFADVLPGPILSRRTKVLFNTVFLGEETKRFAESWTGAGVDSSVVDPDVLRAIWLSDWPSNLSSGLLQSAWLADNST